MQYEHGGHSFANRRDAVEALARSFISGDGWNYSEAIQDWLDDSDFPSECANEMLSDWDCNIAPVGSEAITPTRQELVSVVSGLTIHGFLND